MNDKLFLLSAEEYIKYENVIPYQNCWWWLRSPSYECYRVAAAYGKGNINDYGYLVNECGCVLPVLRVENPKSSNLKVGDCIVVYKFPFIIIDATVGLAIAEVPIAFRRFDRESNDYQNSEIRQFLVEWAVEREG